MKIIPSAGQRRPCALRTTKKQLQHKYSLRSMSSSDVNLTRRPIVLLEDFINTNQVHLTKRPIVLLEDLFNTNEVLTTQTSWLLALNDNCILYVLENLSLANLCTMAEVSVRLKQLAQYQFRLKYNDLNMESLADGDNKVSMKQARSLFYNFGHLIKSLHVSRKDFVFDQPQNNPFRGQKRLLWLIRKYCCSLDSLTLGHFWLNMTLIRKSLTIFMKLKTLNFYKVSCYCPEEKTFHHFANILPLIFQIQKLQHQMPQLVQLI